MSAARGAFWFMWVYAFVIGLLLCIFWEMKIGVLFLGGFALGLYAAWAAESDR